MINGERRMARKQPREAKANNEVKDLEAMAKKKGI